MKVKEMTQRLTEKPECAGKDVDLMTSINFHD